MKPGMYNTIADARSWLREHAARGEKCPCCGRLCKVYRRPLNSVTARFVAALYTEHGRDWGHLAAVSRKRLPDVAHQGGQLVLAAHWGLIEPSSPGRGENGRTGYWRVTERGEDWLLGATTVPKYVHLLNGQVLALDGPLITREDALGEHFDLTALMAAPGTRPPANLFDLPEVA